MELQDFITNTIVQIAQGIEGAKLQLEDSEAIVNPRHVSDTGNGDSPIYGYLNTNENFYKAVQKIEFDVAVTAEQGKETKGGIGIQVGSIGLGAQGKSESGSSSISRIQFTIPMVFPMEDTTE